MCSCRNYFRVFLRFLEHFRSVFQVRYEGDPEAALITYATRNQAQAAYKSTAPILNNRFIKVFWHNANKDTTDRGAFGGTSVTPVTTTSGAPWKQAPMGGYSVKTRLGPFSKVNAGFGANLNCQQPEDTSMVEPGALETADGRREQNAKVALFAVCFNLSKILTDI